MLGALSWTNPLNPVWAVLAFLLALVTVRLMIVKIEPPPLSGRFATIDGLRGYLGFAVFVGHASIWYLYSTQGVWIGPASRLYNGLGGTAVSFFFMITAFLFVTRLMDNRAKGVDFFQLYVSRVMRLTPLYLLALALMLVAVGIKTGWRLQVDISDLVLQIAQWVAFAMPGGPDINGFHPTSVIMSGVYWTLAYEWVFYFCLPLIAWALGMRPGAVYIVISLLFLAVFFRYTFYYFSFLGGIFAAVVARYPAFQQWSRRRSSSFIVLLLLAVNIGFRSPSIAAVTLAAGSLAFAIIASGNTLFGVLTHACSRALGEFTYGIYLLHGLLLFATFNFVLSPAWVSRMTAPQYWGVILLMTPLLIVISALTFYFIERPCVGMAKPLSKWLRRKKTQLPATA